MTNKHEEILKNKINNYMEQIQVPENLGGIIMENFEKMREEENINNKPKNKKALKISIASVAVVVLVGIGIFVGTKLVGDKTITIDNNGAQNSNIASNNIQNIDTIKLDEVIKKELIKLAEKEYSSNKSSNNTYAEAHIILRSEIKDNKIYSYILAEYGVYVSQNTDNPQSEGGASMPLTLIFEVSSLGEYNLTEIKKPSDGADYESSLKEMFPEDLLNSVENLTNGTYTAEFNKQILEYLKANNVSTTSDKLVTDLFTYTGTTKDGNNTSVNYKIPKININSNDVTTINNEISNKILAIAKNEVSAINKGNGIGVYRINYEYYINSDILSIVIRSDFEGDLTNYNVYNIDKNTGKRINNDILLKLKGISKEEFTKKLSIVAGKKFEEKYLKNNHTNSEYNTQYSKTVSSNNCTPDDKLMFLDSNKNLNVVTRIYSLAGAENYEHILNIDNIVSNNTSESLTAEETTQLTNFLNDKVNNLFTKMRYTSPENLFTNMTSAEEDVLGCAMFTEDNPYRSILTEDQQRKIYGKTAKEDESGMLPVTYITEENLVKFLKEKMNYTYPKETIRNKFSNSNMYKPVINSYVGYFTGTAYCSVSINKGNKIGNKYYLTLKEDNSYSSVNIVLVKENNTYYFYSCDYKTSK